MKKTPIFILICLLIAILSISLIFTSCKKTSSVDIKEATSTSEASEKEEAAGSPESDTPSEESPEKYTTAVEPFILPVDTKYLDTAFIDKRPLEGDTYETTFLLDKGTEINAILPGKIVILSMLEQFLGKDVTPYYWVEILTADNLNLTYLLIGEVLINEDDAVSQGQKIAVSAGGDFAADIKGNFKIRIAQETNEEWKYFDLLQ